MMQPKDRESLNALIEFHERTWGTKHYRGRPSLSAILSSPVVIFGAPTILKKNVG